MSKLTCMIAMAGLIVGSGCKGKTGGGAAPARHDAAAAAADAAVAVGPDGGSAEPPDGPDEAAVREGKRTGLGAPDEKPEVATEDLIEAIVAGRVAWTRFIDPVHGVVELRVPADASGPVARRCGAGLTAALDTLTKAMTAAAGSGLGYTLDCDNAGLFTPDPGGAMAAATCSLESPAAGTTIVDIVFVPDPALGLRIVGLSTTPSEADPGAALTDFEAQMADTSARCP